MGEYCRAHDIVMAVDRIRTREDRDRMGAMCKVCRRLIAPVRKGERPTRWSELVAVGRGVTAIEDRAEVNVAQIFRSDAGNVGLDQLADLLLGRHAGDQRRETRLERGVRSERGAHCGPEIGMHDGCIFRRVRGGNTHPHSGDYRTKDTGSDFQCAYEIKLAGHRSLRCGLIAPGPDCPDVHREEALTMDVVPIYGRDSDQHPTLMTALSMN